MQFMWQVVVFSLHFFFYGICLRLLQPHFYFQSSSSSRSVPLGVTTKLPEVKALHFQLLWLPRDPVISNDKPGCWGARDYVTSQTNNWQAGKKIRCIPNEPDKHTRISVPPPPHVRHLQSATQSYNHWHPLCDLLLFMFHFRCQHNTFLGCWQIGK